MIKLILKNTIFQYVFSRYSIYLLQFLNSIFLAVYLGPYYMGVYGFIQLIIAYFNQFNFGIPFALNNILSIHKNKSKYVSFTFNTGLSLVILLSIIVFLLFLISYLTNINIGKAYNFKEYSFIVCFIVILNYLNSIFINLFRVYNKLWEITFSQAIYPICICISIFFSKGEQLLNNLVWSNLISFLIVFILFLVRSPLSFHPIIAPSILKNLKNKSLLLFVYNSSFYLIFISTRSLVSINYSVSEFGLFTFSFTLAGIVFLLLDSFSFLIFPKLLNRLATIGNEKAHDLIKDMRSKYVLLAHILTYFSILSYKLFMCFFSKYQSTVTVFIFIALTQLVYSQCFGYPALLMARKKEKEIAFFALLSLIINILFGLILTNYFEVDYSYVILTSTFTYIIYTILVAKKGLKELNQDNSLTLVFRIIFPWRLLIPIIIGFTVGTVKISTYQYTLPLIAFIIFNIKDLKSLILELKSIITKPDITKI